MPPSLATPTPSVGVLRPTESSPSPRKPPMRYLPALGPLLPHMEMLGGLARSHNLPNIMCSLLTLQPWALLVSTGRGRAYGHTIEVGHSLWEEGLGRGSLSRDEPQVARIPSSFHSSHMALGYIRTRNKDCMAPSSKKDGAGAYRIDDSSFLIYFVYISLLRFHLNKILVSTKRSPRNCRIAVMLSHDRWGA